MNIPAPPSDNNRPPLGHYPPDVIGAATRAIDSTKAAGYISQYGYGEPIPGKPGYYRGGQRLVKEPFFNLVEVATALLFLVGGPVKVLARVPRGASTSYTWKHEAERWGQLIGLSPYVSNAAFIVAADFLYVPSRRNPNSPNIEYGLAFTREHADALSQAWQRRMA